MLNVIEWRCAECGHHAGNSDALLSHVWAAHAKDIITAQPSIIEALWRSAARKHVEGDMKVSGGFQYAVQVQEHSGKWSNRFSGDERETIEKLFDAHVQHGVLPIRLIDQTTGDVLRAFSRRA